MKQLAEVMLKNCSTSSKPTVAVIGGGVAGATAALHLAELGIDVHLVEKRDSLVSGPPICHLHAGGNLYREISLQQCIELLHQSIDIVRLYPHTLNQRPTVVATPKTDEGDPAELFERLETIKQAYQTLVTEDAANKVLGEPDNYYQAITRAQLEQLKGAKQPEHPKVAEDWLIPFANKVDLDALKYPVVLVQEYGWSVFRLAASATLAFESLPQCHLHLNTKLNHAEWVENRWQLQLSDSQEKESSLEVDYLINACGYQTGEVDDIVAKPRERLVEFKAAYVSKWADDSDVWPEVIFHGTRGTPHGMAQLTPYANGVFQLHGMTKEITLFEDGLVSSSVDSSQPNLPDYLNHKIEQGWDPSVAQTRTEKAILHLAKLIPEYSKAVTMGTPLFGAQQIPGQDDTLRSADVTFEDNGYARIEIVKGSSALEAIKKVVNHWQLFSYDDASLESLHPVSHKLTSQEVEACAVELAEKRGYPVELAQIYPSNQNS